MFRVWFGVVFFVISLLFPVVSGQEIELPPARQEPAMKAELESVYHEWRTAMINSDQKAWEKATALYRQMETRNRIVSERHPFPEALFDSEMVPPSLANLISLGVFTRKDTASSIYFGKADFGISDPGEVKDTLLVLRYLKEEGAWRFDNSRIVRIGQNPEVLHQIARQDLSFLVGDEFQPLGFIPIIPQAVGAPELMGEIWITSIGFQTEIWVNSHRVGKVENNMGRELVMGGIRKQNNQITLRTKKIPSGNHTPRFEVAIYAAKEPGEPATRVFHYGPLEVVEAEIQTGFMGRVLK